jgi:hypothetical protein
MVDTILEVRVGANHKATTQGKLPAKNWVCPHSQAWCLSLALHQEQLAFPLKSWDADDLSPG